MENTAKTFGNTNTSVFPLQTRKRGQGGVDAGHGGASLQFQSREVEPGGPPPVQGQPELQSKILYQTNMPRRWIKGLSGGLPGNCGCWGSLAAAKS